MSRATAGRAANVDASTAADLAWCEALTRRHSASFRLAFGTLPKEKASAVWAVYAFCRLADDAVDAPADPEDFDLLRLQWRRFREGSTPSSHMWRALRWATDRFGLPTAPFDDLLAGLDSDRAFRQPEDDAELLLYCDRVAGTVGRMLLPILAARVPPQERTALSDAATALGCAMQLTNILRDVGEDRRMGRIYLPAAAMRETGVTAEDLDAAVPSADFVALWERYAALAEADYAATLSAAPRFDPDSRKALRVSAKAYRAILHEVRRHGYDCLVNRTVVPAWRKAVLLLGG